MGGIWCSSLGGFPSFTRLYITCSLCLPGLKPSLPGRAEADGQALFCRALSGVQKHWKIISLRQASPSMTSAAGFLSFVESWDEKEGHENKKGTTWDVTEEWEKGNWR